LILLLDIDSISAARIDDSMPLKVRSNMEFREDVYLGMESPLLPPLENGAGCCKTVEDVKVLAGSEAGGIVYGSITWEENDGNPGNTFEMIGDKALNAIGLRNPGRRGMIRDLPAMVNIAHGAGKKLTASVSCNTPEEYAGLTEIAFHLGADAVEVNLACPNKRATGKSKRAPLICYNPTATGDVLSAIEGAVGKDAAVHLKVASYLDMAVIENVSDVILASPVCKAIVTTNTLFGALAFDKHGKPVITVGLAGLSGPPIQEIRTGQVFLWNEMLEGKIPVVAVGGIGSGWDIYQSHCAGAVAFQIVTELFKGSHLNPKVFFRVIDEYINLELSK
jgi:dihydroorotate dehydrogenase (fumarate)